MGGTRASKATKRLPGVGVSEAGEGDPKRFYIRIADDEVMMIEE